LAVTDWRLRRWRLWFLVLSNASQSKKDKTSLSQRQRTITKYLKVSYGEERDDPKRLRNYSNDYPTRETEERQTFRELKVSAKTVEENRGKKGFSSKTVSMLA